jgi:hypothetical protein
LSFGFVSSVDVIPTPNPPRNCNKTVTGSKQTAGIVRSRSISVIVEPQSFTVDTAGNPRFLPLDPSIRLTLSPTSFEIPPQATRFVLYEASSETLPAWFVINSTFSKLPAGDPPATSPHSHMVYLLQRDRLTREDVRIEAATYERSTKTMEFTIFNSSKKLGRVIQWELEGTKELQTGGGFPLYPGSRRVVRTKWESVRAAETVSLRFADFSLTQALSASTK